MSYYGNISVYMELVVKEGGECVLIKSNKPTLHAMNEKKRVKFFEYFLD